MHAALADGARLRIVDLLAVGDRSPSEIGSALGLPSNLLAHHLGVLESAGLVTRHRSEGDRRRTYLSLTARGHDQSPGTDTGVRPPPFRRVLFVCTANTARSHLAAALWRRASPVEAASAGTHPGERIHRGVVDAARRHGLDLPDVAPRLLSETLDRADLVITVCDRAHEEVGELGWAHWSVPDPVPVGTATAFDAAHEALAERIRDVAPRLGAAAAG